MVLLVLTSGAGISVSGPMYAAIARIYARERRSSSSGERLLGSTITPHFPHHKGRFATAHLRDIHKLSVATSSLSTCGWNLIPHLYGHLTLLCWDLYPWKTRKEPSSIITGRDTSIMRSGANSLSIRWLTGRSVCIRVASVRNVSWVSWRSHIGDPELWGK